LGKLGTSDNKVLLNGVPQKIIDSSTSDNVNANIDLALEYLYTTASKLKWGIGICYSLSRSVSFSNSEKQVFEDLGLDEIKVSAYPIYVTLQFYPIKSLENLYLKGNLGLAILHIKPSYDDIINSFLRALDPDK
jgi:hypothetical protein